MTRRRSIPTSSPARPTRVSSRACALWGTVSDQKNLVYYFDSSTPSNTFWASLTRLNLKPGAPVRKLTIQNGEVFSGEVSGAFKDAEPFQFLPATPN